MLEWVEQLKNYFEPAQSGRVAYKYYVRTGECHGCGQCCAGIHLIHGNEVIDSVEKFERLKLRYEDYRHFVPIGETEAGITFRCVNLQPDNSCGIYADRPLFCKKYPSETTMLYGGGLAPQCGFAFEAKHKFDAILSRVMEKKQLQPGKLLNDVLPSTMVARAPDDEAMSNPMMPHVAADDVTVFCSKTN